MRRHWLGSGIDLDAGNDADLFKRLGERNPSRGLLMDGFIHQNGAVEAIAEAGSV